MLDNLKFFLEYRKQNKIGSRSLGIKRDLKVELFLLLGLWKSKQLVRILKRNCCCYLEYYEKKGLIPNFKQLNYIISRVAAIYNIIEDDKLLEAEIENFDDCFSQAYVKNKVNELTNKSDIENKNLVVRAVT